MMKRWAAMGLLLLAGSVALSACGGAKEPAAPVEPTAEAAPLVEPTVAAPEAQPTIEVPTAGASAAMTGTGAVTNTAATTDTAAVTDTGTMSSTEPAVDFLEPRDGAIVTSPFSVCLTATGVVIEKSGEAKVGHGHHHLIIDPGQADFSDIMNTGAAIPKDERHIHLGDGSNCTTLTLPSGQHRIMAVVADGAHIPIIPLIAKIHLVIVK